MSTQRSAEWPTELEKLYKRESRQLWAMFYAHCGDADRAFDALQESFYRLYRHEGEPIRDLRAWLLRVGQNWLRDVARRKGSTVRPVEQGEREDSRQTEPAFVLCDEETRSQVRRILGELRRDDRAVLILRYGLGWSSQRMADVLEITPAAIDMRLSRARKRMAELLQASGITHE